VHVDRVEPVRGGESEHVAPLIRTVLEEQPASGLEVIPRAGEQRANRVEAVRAAVERETRLEA
jgi:hypothetical protein